MQCFWCMSWCKWMKCMHMLSQDIFHSWLSHVINLPNNVVLLLSQAFSWNHPFTLGSRWNHPFTLGSRWNHPFTMGSRWNHPFTMGSKPQLVVVSGLSVGIPFTVGFRLQLVVVSSLSVGIPFTVGFRPSRSLWLLRSLILKIFLSLL
jgi:hypothetical protein